MKQRIVLTESKLRNMIKEAVKDIINEVNFNQNQLAYMSGLAAQKADTLKGRMSGLTGQKNNYRARKLRQADLFGNRAADKSPYADETGSEYDTDFYHNNYVPKKGFNIKRTQGDGKTYRNFTGNGVNNGQTMNREEFYNQIKGEINNTPKYSWEQPKYNVYADNRSLNRAYQQGQKGNTEYYNKLGQE